jgi:uncharacterized damage-inducible protein DinB
MAGTEELIKRYEQGVAALELALRDLPEAALDRIPAPGKWSIRQIAAHLADAEIVVAARLRWVAAEPGSLLKAFDQETWANKLHYEHRSLQQSLELFRALRHATASMLRSLPEPAWLHTGTHEERGEVSLRRLVEDYSSHAERHTGQILELRGGA